MSQPICTYQYTYGAGNTPNREIKFYGDGQKMWGEVYGKRQNLWQLLGEIDESQMTKEGASTTEKIRLMMEARGSLQPPVYPPDQPFKKMPYEDRIKIIQNLQPNENYRITIRNDIGSNPFFEKAESLTFFDPT